jgi:TRAP-type C4-dicarboxylate transport system permease small subunit
MKGLKRVSHTINKAVSYTGIVMFVGLVFACVMQVFFRFVLNNSLSWTEELARYLFVWMHLIGASLLIEDNGHATVTVILDLLHGKTRKAVNILIEAIILIDGTLMLYSGVIVSYRSRTNVSTAMSIPMWVINLSVAVSGALLMFQAIVQIAVYLSDKAEKKEGTAE